MLDQTSPWSCTQGPRYESLLKHMRAYVQTLPLSKAAIQKPYGWYDGCEIR